MSLHYLLIYLCSHATTTLTATSAVYYEFSLFINLPLGNHFHQTSFQICQHAEVCYQLSLVQIYFPVKTKINDLLLLQLLIKTVGNSFKSEVGQVFHELNNILISHCRLSQIGIEEIKATGVSFILPKCLVMLGQTVIIIRYW